MTSRKNVTQDLNMLIHSSKHKKYDRYAIIRYIKDDDQYVLMSISSSNDISHNINTYVLPINKDFKIYISKTEFTMEKSNMKYAMMRYHDTLSDVKKYINVLISTFENPKISVLSATYHGIFTLLSLDEPTSTATDGVS